MVIDAIREKQPAIASILQLKGGMSGQDPRLEETRHQHAIKRKETLAQKQVRREERMALFHQQTNLFARQQEVYKIMSAELPALCKYIHLLR